MPIINIVAQGDLSNMKIKLDKAMTFNALKLLHIYHNINSKVFSKVIDREDNAPDSHIQDHQRILFARFNFINEENSTTYFCGNNEDSGVNNNESDNLVCLGLSKHNADKMYQFKDLYKVISSDIPKIINQQINIQLYTISSTGVKIKLKPEDFVVKGATEHSHIIFTFEYE